MAFFFAGLEAVAVFVERRSFAVVFARLFDVVGLSPAFIACPKSPDKLSHRPEPATGKWHPVGDMCDRGPSARDGDHLRIDEVADPVQVNVKMWPLLVAVAQPKIEGKATN